MSKSTTGPWLIQMVDAMGQTTFLTRVRILGGMAWKFWGTAAEAQRFDSWREARQVMRLLDSRAETIRLADVEVTQ